MGEAGSWILCAGLFNLFPHIALFSIVSHLACLLGERGNRNVLGKSINEIYPVTTPKAQGGRISLWHSGPFKKRLCRFPLPTLWLPFLPPTCQPGAYCNCSRCWPLLIQLRFMLRKLWEALRIHPGGPGFSQRTNKGSRGWVSLALMRYLLALPAARSAPCALLEADWQQEAKLSPQLSPGSMAAPWTACCLHGCPGKTIHLVKIV